jgi:Uma2 family endonuclease
MSMPAIRPVTTIEELWALPEDGTRHELLDGVHVVTPSPAYGHQYLVSRLHGALTRALDGRPDLVTLASPADIVLGPRTLVQPDLFVLRINPGSPPRSWSEAGVPMVAIEVLSPSTAPRDRGAKRRIYQRAGVEEYWVVDMDARLIERWTPEDTRPEIIDERLEWRDGGTTLLVLTLDQLFGAPAPGR